jgi:hypothetical protein
MNKLSDEILDGYQYVRVIDVFVLAPAFIYASTFKSLPESLRVILFVSGVATAAFNGYNFIRIEQEKVEKKLSEQE